MGVIEKTESGKTSGPSIATEPPTADPVSQQDTYSAPALHPYPDLNARAAETPAQYTAPYPPAAPVQGYPQQGYPQPPQQVYNVQPQPIPGYPIRALRPPGPGEVLVGYELRRYQSGCCMCEGMKTEGIIAIIILVLLWWPIAWIPCILPDCFQEYQSPVYGMPAQPQAPAQAPAYVPYPTAYPDGVPPPPGQVV